MVATGTADRLQQAVERMPAEEIDLLLVTPSADLRYLTGYGAHPSERPTVLAVQPGAPAVMLVPALEAPRAGALSGIELQVYGETDNPYPALAGALGPLPASATIAISDQAWARVLLHLQATFPDARFISASPLLRQLRMTKSRDEIELLAAAGAAADAVFDEIVTRPFQGRSERAIAAEITALLQARGLEPWGAIVASGPNAASPHHITGDRNLDSGDAVVLDYGGALDGYHSDITRTVHVGPPDQTFLDVYEVVRRAQQAGVDAVRPGVPAQDVDRAARGVIEEAGYGDYFVHRTGHGLGLDVHEEPYMVEGNELLLETGMVFSVEPGIYLPGRFGVRIEDIVAVTETGARRLNEASREPIVVS